MKIQLAILLTALLIGPARVAAQEPTDILEDADRQRAPWDSFSLAATIKSQGNRGEAVHRYRVYSKDKEKTLVSFLEPATEEGNLLLMVEDDLWYYVNDTRRPIRITPIQRLSGSVSYGDIARLNWTLDYEVEGLMEDTISYGGGEVQAKKLLLQAKSKGATYQRINLWVSQDEHTPLKAEVFLSSGKHYKTLFFTAYERVDGKRVNVQVKFIDHLKNDAESLLELSDFEPRSIPDRYFLKTGLPELSHEI